MKQSTNRSLFKAALGAILCIYLLSCTAAPADTSESGNTYTISTLKETSDKGWGETAKDGEREYRPVQPGSRSWIGIPNWWGGRSVLQRVNGM